jgi:hypothetical protein
LFPDPEGTDLFVPTVGTFTVNIINRVSNLVDSSVSRLDLTQLLPAVYLDATNGDDANDGTPTAPVLTIGRARTLADADNLREFRLRGSFTLDQTYNDWTFIGLGSEQSDVLTLNGQNVANSNFVDVGILGTGTGSVQARVCTLDGVTGLSGIFRQCGFKGTTAWPATGTIIVHDSFSEIAGSGRPVFDFQTNATVDAMFRGYIGGMDVRNMTGGNLSLDVVSGTIDLDSSLTGGNVVIRGAGLVSDRSVGASVTLTEGFLDGSEMFLLQQLVAGNATISPDDLTITVFDRDGVTTLATYSMSVDGRIRVRTS